MCIIIHKPADATLALSSVLRSYQRNDDGWGIAAITPEGLVIRRGFGSDADATLLDAYEELRQFELVLHCRIATAGSLSIANTHPFNVNGDLWMFHNGTIQIDRSAAPDYCDSYHVARSIASTLGSEAPEVLRDPEYQATLGEWAKGSKLVFIDRSGVVIVNEKAGIRRDGCWFSNESSDEDYLTFRSTTTTSADGVDDIDDYGSFSGQYYDGITPRCYRVETQEDADTLHLETLSFLDTLKKLDVDDIAEYCITEPELAAEALYLLVNSRMFESASL